MMKCLVRNRAFRFFLSKIDPLVKVVRATGLFLRLSLCLRRGVGTSTISLSPRPVTSQAFSRRFRSTRGAAAKSALFGIVFFAVLASIVCSVLLYVFGILIHPGVVGLRSIAFGPFRGYSTATLRPGLHWNIPYYSQVFTLPHTIRTINFHRGSMEGQAEAGPLQVPTGADRAIVEVDVTLLYKVYPDSGVDAGVTHGGAAELVQKFSVQTTAWDDGIRLTAENNLKIALRKLSASDFYNPEKREAAVYEAKGRIVKELAPYGVNVLAVLLRRYTYENETLEENIFNKNLETQNQRVKEEEKKLGDAQASYREVESKGTGAINTLRSNSENDASSIVSSGATYEAKKKAEGDLLVAQAKAEVDRLKATALEHSVGADIYVARQLAPILGSLKGGVVSQLDPYDLESWMKRLGIVEAAPTAPKSTQRSSERKELVVRGE